MTKKKLMAMVSVFLAVTMTVAPAVTAFAEGEDAKETVWDSGTYNSVTVDGGQAGINIAEGEVVSVTGDVKVTNEEENGWAHPAIMNYAGIVSVEGDVTAEGPLHASGVTSSDGLVTVGGIVDAQKGVEGVFAMGENALVAVNNRNDDEVAVFGGQYGVTALEGATVNVIGSVVATSIRENENESSAAVHAGDTANVTILGDITSPEKGLELELTGSEKKGYVFIDGTVSGGTGSISLQDGGFEKTPQLGELSKALPSITLWFLEGDLDHKLAMDGTFLQGLSNEEQGKLFTDVYESINYIIRENPDSEATSTYKLSTEEGFSDGVKTVKMGKPITVSPIDGYEITSVEAGAGSNHVTKNSDGTYTVVTEFGGIALAVKVKKIVNEETGEVTYEVVEQTQTTTPTPTQEVVPVVSTGSTTTASVGGTPIAAISGEKVAKTVAFSVSNVTPVQYKNAIIENVTSAPANGAFNIVTDQVSCFDTKMIEAFASRPDVDVNVVFTYNGRKIKVVIPAGYDVRSLLDANGYCGYLRLLSLLGGTDL